MAGNTDVLGIGELRQQFARLKDVDRGARRATVAGGQRLKKSAKGIALAKGLRKSGALINNIVIKRERTPAGVAEYHIGVRHGRALTRKQKKSHHLAVAANGRIVKRYDNDPYYWRFPEFGTKHQPATPYLSEALERDATQALDAMSNALDKEIQRQAQS